MNKNNYKESWPKKCSCCPAQYDEEQWEGLYYVGLQKANGVKDMPNFELRNCAYCSTTLSQPVLIDDFVIAV